MPKVPYTVKPELLEALFDPIGMEIVKMLEERPRSVQEISAELSLTDPDAVAQLDVLVKAGIIRITKDESGSLYELAHTNFATIADLMDQTMRDRMEDEGTDQNEEVEL